MSAAICWKITTELIIFIYMGGGGGAHIWALKYDHIGFIKLSIKVNFFDWEHCKLCWIPRQCNKKMIRILAIKYELSK